MRYFVITKNINKSNVYLIEFNKKVSQVYRNMKLLTYLINLSSPETKNVTNQLYDRDECSIKEKKQHSQKIF